MNKTLSTLLVGASLLAPIQTSASNIRDKTSEDVSQVLVDGPLEWGELQRRQARIQKLIPEIKEPIILGDLTQPDVAITIDDGYGKESIEYMLNLFERNGVKATFFVIGECLKLYPSLRRKAVEQGHEICNHTMNHNKYFKTGNEPKRFESELLGWEEIAKNILGEEYLVQMKKNYPFFRFPGMHGIRVQAYLDILKKHGYIPIGWWHTKNPEIGNINNGDIFLWHFKNADTLNVRKNLEMVLQTGKQPKTVSDIITSENYDEPIDWTNYAKKRREAKDL